MEKLIVFEELDQLTNGTSICIHCQRPCNYQIEEIRHGQAKINLRCCDTPLTVQGNASMLNINSAQQWLCDPDISQAHTIKHWLEEELNISIHQVLSMEVQADTIERPPEGQYKRFELGRFSCFVLTLLDGSKIYRSFRRGD